MESLSGSGTPSGVAKDELSVPAMCKKARLENTALGMRRRDLRDKIAVLREKCKQEEDNYWRQYHVRLNSTASDGDASPEQWIGKFAKIESTVAKHTKQRLDELRRQIHELESQLQDADDEFWAKWQAGMMKLAHAPRLSPSLPEPSQMPQLSQRSATDHANNTSVDTTMAPLSQHHRRTSMPHGPAHSTVKVHPKIATGAQSKTLHGQAGVGQAKGPAIPHGKNVKSPNVLAKAGNTVPSRPISYQAASPLARPPFFPTGPPSATFTTDQGRVAKPNTALAWNFPPQVAGSTVSPRPRHNATTTKKENTSFQGVTDPKVGHIYKAYYKHDNHEGWWMCTVLPTLPAHEAEAWAREVGISFRSPKLDLWLDAPKCYDLTTQTKRKMGKLANKHHTITGWNFGYGDGQPLVTERVFPVLFFEDRKGVQGHFDVPMPPKKFIFKPHTWDWVEAKNLRPHDADVGFVHGTTSADRFAKRLAILKQKESNPSRDYPHTSTPEKEGPPTKKIRIKFITRTRQPTLAQPPLANYEQGQEDSEMTDAGSLAGDTIAASSTCLSDDELS